MDFKNVKLNRIILFSILICICLASCSFETIESNFATYEEALNKNYFEKGWIPKELVNKKMKKIYVKNDLDRNTCIFSYQLPSSEIEILEENLIRFEQNYTERLNIKNSKWFEKDILNLPKYRSNNFKHGIAINKDKRIVYGWLN